ncbi:hypothetical protein [Sporomusa acidovorans]|nr:hypothetical protein [Sporomusa acidovorans]
MDLNSMEAMFLNDWVQHDFSTWNESDIREEFIAPLLRMLGYSKGTINEIIREPHLKLSKPFHRVGRKHISIDYVPTIRLKSFWIIEAKPGNRKDMDYGDLLQAHLYAIHPEIQARVIVLINGWEIRVYDALSIEDWNQPLLICTQENCKEKFEELKKIISAPNMLSYQRSRLLEIARNTFSVEIDEQQIKTFQSDVNKLVAECAPIVRENAKQLQIMAWKQAEKEEIEQLRNTKEKLLLVHMDIPTDARLVSAQEYLRRIIEGNDSERIRLIDLLAMNFRARPHAIFRVNCVYILLVLISRNIEIGPSLYSRSVKESFEELVLANVSYWIFSDLSNSLCHLDNISFRLAKKIGMKIAMDHLAKRVGDLKSTLSVEDLLRQRPTVARHMSGFIGLLGENFWREFCSLSKAEEIWNGIWLYEKIENFIDQLPDKKYPDGDSDLLWFNYYGRGFDMLLLGTWDVLHNSVNAMAEKNIRQEILDFAKLEREQVLSIIPRAKECPDDWHPDSEQLRNIMDRYLNLR